MRNDFLLEIEVPSLASFTHVLLNGNAKRALRQKHKYKRIYFTIEKNMDDAGELLSIL